ncbi:LIC_10705 family lipoprotein [Leptospira interrogans]|uniref:LIC_10705 family lipoprotein n=1 Tax=Leptospira interrogans TaxID=173 RepID=UPI00046C686A|nr:LIC_10705 family lipoprotein [Leptospira interrogans]
MLKKILCLILISYLNLYCDYSQGTSTSDYYNEFMLEYSIFFILPNLDLNQYCPPTEEIPILEPGTYTRYMSEGDTYIFDNRARLNARTSTFGLSRYFTFIIQENPEQDIKLTTPECGTSPYEFRSNQDSGQLGQLENIYIELSVPPLPVKRSSFFTKLKAVSGSGTVTFTTPNVPDPPEAH